MTFRLATTSDAKLLYAWRLADELAVDYPTSTTFTAHCIWLTERVHSPLVKLLIWEEHGVPVGMVRRDSNDELAYHATSDEVAGRMLSAVVAECEAAGRRLKATLDADDAKVRQLERAGFQAYPSVALTYRP